MISKYRVVIGIILVITHITFAESVKVNVTPSRILLGNTLHYSIVINYSEKIKLVSIPSKKLFESASYDVKLLDFHFKKVKNKQNYMVTLRYDLAIFETGLHNVPSHAIIFSENKKLKKYLISNQKITIVSTPVEPNIQPNHLSLQKTITPNTITVGDPIRYSIQIQYPKKIKLHTIPPQTLFDSAPYDIERVDYRVEKYSDNQSYTTTIHYDVILFESGTHRIPTHAIHFSVENQLEKHVISDQVFQVDSVLPLNQKDSHSIKDIKPLLQLRFPFKLMIILSISSVVFILLTGVGIWYFRRERHHQSKDTELALKKSVTLLDPRPLGVRYIEKFNQLKEAVSYIKNDYDTFYVNLIKVLRHYLSERYSSCTLESTTNEILECLKTDVQQHILRQLSEVLNSGLVVKFANVDPDHTAHDNIIDTCIDIVTNTAMIEDDDSR